MNIIDYTIHSAAASTGSTHDDYIYVNADVTVKLQVNDEAFTIYLQNGDYLNNDYNRPSSEFSIITEFSNTGCELLQRYSAEDLEDSKNIAELNAETEKGWNAVQWRRLYDAINDAVCLAFQEVVIPEVSRVEKYISMLDNTYHFVEVIEREIYNDALRVCAEPIVHKFATHEEAVNVCNAQQDNDNLALLVNATRYYQLEVQEGA